MDIQTALQAAEVQAALLRYDLIPAVKALRSLTGCGLAEAKEAIDAELAAAQPDAPLGAVVRQRKLDNCAFDLVDQCREGVLPQEEVLPRLMAAVPDRDADSYATAIAEAWRATL